MANTLVIFLIWFMLWLKVLNHSTFPCFAACLTRRMWVRVRRRHNEYIINTYMYIYWRGESSFLSIHGIWIGNTKSKTLTLEWIAFPFFRNISQKFQKLFNEYKIRTCFSWIFISRWTKIQTDRQTTDQAGKHFSIVCREFYVLCLLKELGISKTKTKGGSNKTYQCLEKKSEMDIVKKHIKYMRRHDIVLIPSEESLPFLYWIPKMHKNPSKQRYIAASHSCFTKPLSKMITYYLKLIQQTHTNNCNRDRR